MLKTPITDTRTVRELARDYVLAREAASAAYTANSVAGRSVEDRIETQLTYDAAFNAQVAARIALDAAQKVAA